MSRFIDTALAFPTVVFSFLLLVVIGYWVLVVAGGADIDALDSEAGTADAEAGGFGGFLAGLGLGGVPATVALSLVIALAWFVSLAGGVLLGRAGLAAPVLFAASVGVLVVALVCAWLGARVIALPLRRLAPDGAAPSCRDFVGRVCVVRTSRVDPGFGQAEVTAPDGSSAVIQVRQTGTDVLSAGSAALIYDYDADGEFFWVVPVDAAFGPPPRTHHSS